jgi:hypothetical protein
MPQDLVCVGSYYTTELAHVARLALESEGIPSFIDNEWISSINWVFTDAVGGVKLLVDSCDAESAIAILSSRSEYKWNEANIAEAEGFEQAASEPEQLILNSSNANEREANVLRAYRGSIVGLLFLPIQFFVLYLLLFKVFANNQPLSNKRKTQAIIALAINLPCILILLLFFRSIVSLFNIQ